MNLLWSHMQHITDICFWTPGKSQGCTHTHSHLGFFVPRFLDNTQLVLVRTAIVICFVSFLPDTTSNPRPEAGDGSRRSWSHHMCIIIFWTTVSSPYAHTIYTGSRCIYVVTYYHWENWLLTDYGWHCKYRLWDADLRSSFGPWNLNFSILGRSQPYRDRRTL